MASSLMSLFPGSCLVSLRPWWPMLTRAVEIPAVEEARHPRQRPRAHQDDANSRRCAATARDAKTPECLRAASTTADAYARPDRCERRRQWRPTGTASDQPAAVNVCSQLLSAAGCVRDTNYLVGWGFAGPGCRSEPVQSTAAAPPSNSDTSLQAARKELRYSGSNAEGHVRAPGSSPSIYNRAGASYCVGHRPGGIQVWS